ncbi:MAG: peptide deformylase [Gammaproteobacteria bacterium]|nr:peptide deformylase [Gammaproteobacteria bacterium]
MCRDFDILKLGHPHLRLTAEAVNDVASDNNQALFKQLLSFVIAQQGIGIAAPQVDSSQRFFIMSSHPNSRYPHAPVMEPTVVINPEILWMSDRKEKDWEGCLSVPGVRALVPRNTEIKVRYTLPTNKIIESTYSGFIARVFQHEYDHLNGLVFLDRIETSHDIMVEDEWQKRIVNQDQHASNTAF